MGSGFKGLIVVLALIVAQAGFAFAGCSEDEIRLRGDWGQARFGIELADNAALRSKGLMHRESLPRSRGMLFAYEAAAEVAFWMRNTLISLDMLFIDEAGVVTKIHHRAQPLSEDLIRSDGEVIAVLEIGGGLAALYGMSVGTQVQHPTFNQARAAWPCAR